MRREYRDPHRGLPDLPGLSRRLPALPAVRVGDHSPGARPEDPHQLQPAFWSGGQRLQVRVHSLSLSPTSHLPLSHLPPLLCSLSLAFSSQSCLDTVWNSATYWWRSTTSAPRERWRYKGGGGRYGDRSCWQLLQRIWGVLVGFCNSYLISREERVSAPGPLAGFEKREQRLSNWWSSVCSSPGKWCLLFIWRQSLPVCIWKEENRVRSARFFRSVCRSRSRRVWSNCWKRCCQKVRGCRRKTQAWAEAVVRFFSPWVDWSAAVSCFMIEIRCVLWEMMKICCFSLSSMT